jgi:endonuclease-3 related protein
MTNQVFDIYLKLYDTYGPQGWWPFINYHGTNETKQGNRAGYHPLDYSFPRNEDEIFEVCLGSILTQNTTFTSVVKSLNNLNQNHCLNYKAIKKLPIETLKSLIKPSGYHNQKAVYLLEFINLFEQLNHRIPTRDELLSIKGIGPETADSILLFGYNLPQFKIDAYTKRLLTHYGLVSERANYHEMKMLMESELEKVLPDRQKRVIVYQEYHALIVNHGKQFFSKQPYGQGCFLMDATEKPIHRKPIHRKSIHKKTIRRKPHSH